LPNFAKFTLPNCHVHVAMSAFWSGQFHISKATLPKWHKSTSPCGLPEWTFKLSTNVNYFFGACNNASIIFWSAQNSALTYETSSIYQQNFIHSSIVKFKNDFMDE
jgi:hypothetical protein